MKKECFYKKDYVKELLKIIRTETDTTKLPKLLSDYHEKDIAEAITLLSENERSNSILSSAHRKWLKSFLSG